MKNKNSKKYDVIIKSAYKDYNTLPFVINSISYLNPQPENIYVISPDGFIPKCNYSIIPIKDIDVFPGVDRKIIKHRPNWCWSTFVALFQKFTKNDLYLDIQSDNIFVKDINLFENNKPNFFISPAHEQNHYPYFKFAKKDF